LKWLVKWVEAKSAKNQVCTDEQVFSKHLAEDSNATALISSPYVSEMKALFLFSLPHALLIFLNCVS
jgi:hypothetical protein